MGRKLGHDFEVISTIDMRRGSNMSMGDARKMATKVNLPQYDLESVEVMAEGKGFTLVNLSATAKPLYRLMLRGVFVESRHYGMGINLHDVVQYLNSQFDVILESDPDWALEPEQVESLALNDDWQARHDERFEDYTDADWREEMAFQDRRSLDRGYDLPISYVHDCAIGGQY
jgi:hypothetical protein